MLTQIHIFMNYQLMLRAMTLHAVSLCLIIKLKMMINRILNLAVSVDVTSQNRNIGFQCRVICFQCCPLPKIYQHTIERNERA